MEHKDFQKKCSAYCLENTDTSCVYFKNENKFRFWLQNFKLGEDFTHHILRYDVIMVVLEGKVEMSIDHRKYVLNQGEMIFLSLFSVVTTKVLLPVKVISLTLNANNYNMCVSRTMAQSDSRDDNQEIAPFSLPLTDSLTVFFDQVRQYIEQIPFCVQIHTNKLMELGVLLYLSYNEKELACFFSSLLKKDSKFAEKINKNLDHFTSVEDMAKRLNMSVSVFNRVFKDVFNESPYKWLLVQKSKIILQYISVHNCTIQDVIDEYNFTSPSHFHRFCIAQYNCTPAVLFKKVRYR